MSLQFQGRQIDDNPLLLEKSYRLRYQVYCLERHFLPVEDYPNQLECDAFDRDSVHVGAVDAQGELAATARIVKPNSAGLPLFRHCTLFPHVTTLKEVGNTVVEVSRVAISRHYARRRDDAPTGAPVVSRTEDRVLDSPPVERRQRSAEPSVERHQRSAEPSVERRQRSAEPFLTLLKAVIYAAKGVRATHLIGATDAALHRWLVHYGFPYRAAGPEAEYYGSVAPHIMSLVELDQVILGRQFAALDGFPVGLDPELWPDAEPDRHIARRRVDGVLVPARLIET